MNKPAIKEPSMDEILSSIRQIIADDSGPLGRPAVSDQAAPAMVEPEADDDTMSGFDAEDAPLALSANQIVGQPVSASPPPLDFSALMSELPAPEAEADSLESPPEFVDPEDISFVNEAETEMTAAAPEPKPAPAPVEPLPRAAPSPGARPTAAQAAPMPDADLSRDIAEQLLEPATGAAVRANFAKLNNLGLGSSGLTIEDVIREMLRPMLKEWLDEHLPTVVERMIEREISRISRGVE